jgi:DNA-binding transcriptional LysR family regulator
VASPSLSRTLLPRAIVNFREVRPGVRVTFQSLGYESIAAALLSHDADLSVVTGYEARAGLTVQKLLEVGLVCALPRSHPLAAKGATSPADLRSCPLISFPNKSFVGRRIESAFSSAGEVRDIAIEVPFPETAISLVGHGVGVAVVDELTALSVNDPGIGSARSCLPRPPPSRSCGRRRIRATATPMSSQGSSARPRKTSRR